MKVLGFHETTIDDVPSTAARIELTIGELDQIANGLAQAVHEVDAWEFHVLVGASADAVQGMVTPLREIVSNAEAWTGLGSPDE